MPRIRTGTSTASSKAPLPCFRWGSGCGLRVSGFELRVSGFGFRVADCGFRVSDFGCWVLGFGVWGFVFRVQSGFAMFQVGIGEAQGLVLRVSGLGFGVKIWAARKLRLCSCGCLVLFLFRRVSGVDRRQARVGSLCACLLWLAVLACFGVRGSYVAALLQIWLAVLACFGVRGSYVAALLQIWLAVPACFVSRIPEP
jgi:hypothetical protein